VQGFSVLEALHGAREHFTHYGGHEQAAGVSVASDRIELVRDAVCARAREMLGPDGFPSPEVRVDAQIPFEQVTRPSANAMKSPCSSPAICASRNRRALSARIRRT
jgi:single-stranded DNA-specific DHH superfamily exonuclease